MAKLIRTIIIILIFSFFNITPLFSCVSDTLAPKTFSQAKTKDYYLIMRILSFIQQNKTTTGIAKIIQNDFKDRRKGKEFFSSATKVLKKYKLLKKLKAFGLNFSKKQQNAIINTFILLSDTEGRYIVNKYSEILDSMINSSDPIIQALGLLLVYKLDIKINDNIKDVTNNLIDHDNDLVRALTYLAMSYANRYTVVQGVFSNKLYTNHLYNLNSEGIDSLNQLIYSSDPIIQCLGFLACFNWDFDINDDDIKAFNKLSNHKNHLIRAVSFILLSQTNNISPDDKDYRLIDKLINSSDPILQSLGLLSAFNFDLNLEEQDKDTLINLIQHDSYLVRALGLTALNHAKDYQLVRGIFKNRLYTYNKYKLNRDNYHLLGELIYSTDPVFQSLGFLATFNMGLTLSGEMISIHKTLLKRKEETGLWQNFIENISLQIKEITGISLKAESLEKLLTEQPFNSQSKAARILKNAA